MTSNLLYATTIKINDAIEIHVPTVGEIYDSEDAYYAAVFAIIATPYDMMVQLDDMGIDFTKINDFDLFMLMFSNLKSLDTSLIFGDLDLSRFTTVQNEQNGDYMLIDLETGTRIDRTIHSMISKSIRSFLHIPRNDKRPGNEEARHYMLERARLKQRRQVAKKRSSQLESYIIALVNTEHFPYNYLTVREISIYQFYASLNQVSHKIHFDNTMIGLYAGTIKSDDLKAHDKTWIATER